MPALIAALVACGLAAPAGADDSPYVDWPALLPALPAPYTESTEADCRAGEEACIDRTIAEMYRRFNTVVPVCNHNAVFSLAYLRVTEDVRDFNRAGGFSDSRWLQHEDAVFARMYFQAYDNWRAGRRTAVPQTWLDTFDTAERREVPALANFLMSMNSHINRDFPFMLAGIGITKPNGVTRKPDHDAYNRRLALLYEPVLAEIARRFDPTADDAEAGPGDNEGAFFVLQSWREGVWRNAERLVNARTPQERAQVAQSIEDYANSVGQSLRTSFRYGSPNGSAARDAHCARHGGQDPSAGRSAGRNGPPGRAFLRWSARARPRLALNRWRVVRVLVGCPFSTAGCRGRITMTYGRRTLASRRFALGPGVGARIPLRLTRAGAAAARRRGATAVRVKLSWSGVASAARLRPPNRAVVLIAR